MAGGPDELETSIDDEKRFDSGVGGGGARLGLHPQTRGRAFTIPVPLQLQTVVAVDKDGNQVLAGSFAGKLQIAGGELASAGGTDIFVAKANKAGAPVFPPLRFGGTGDDAATGVAVDDDGSIVLAGTFQGEAELGGQRLRAEVRHPGQRAVFVARLDPAGKTVWVKQIAVANLPTQVSVAVGPDHNIVVGVTATGTVANKNGQLALAGQSVTLDVLSPKGEPIPQPGSHVMALSLPVGCAHSPCTTGGVLVPGCGPDACVAWICGVDSYLLQRRVGLDLCQRGRHRLPAQMQLRQDLRRGQPVLSGCLRLHGSQCSARIPTAENPPGTAICVSEANAASATLAARAAGPSPGGSVRGRGEEGPQESSRAG